MRTKIEEMKELVGQLNKAAHYYYQKNSEILSDKEYDEKYDRLCLLEKETGIILSKSPTEKVGSEVVSSLNKVRHKTVLLSLDKTKEIEKLVQFVGKETALLSWKLDGLTVVLNYSEGRLKEALTRGNGEIGEDITHNAKLFANIPLQIDYKGDVSVRGEAVITFEEFQRINEQLPDEEKYKNPRNLTSGTVRQLNSDQLRNRNVTFYAFSLISDDFSDSKYENLKSLEKWVFDIVETAIVTEHNLETEVQSFKDRIKDNSFATDGLVITFDSMAYSNSLGVTSKFPRDSIAFKWADELAETKLKYIEWNTSRTGLVNPIAVFDEVELEGTTVSRASVHNISMVRQLELGEGDSILVYKANMIIPQIYDNLTRSKGCKTPDVCPTCGGRTEIKTLKEQEALYCTNDKCLAKNISFLEHFVARNAMNIEGLSVKALEKFVESGFIHNYIDIYKLERHFEDIKKMEGFGEKSASKLLEAVNNSKSISLPNFIFALGISNVGLSNAKLLCKHFGYDLDRIINASYEDLENIKGFGEMIAKSLTDYFGDKDNLTLIEEMRTILDFIQQEEDNTGKALENAVVVITGELKHFENRKQLEERIEKAGGKVTGSVTGKTTYLINNDVFSNSSKNKKAKDLGVKIISEEDFIKAFLYMPT